MKSEHNMPTVKTTALTADVIVEWVTRAARSGLPTETLVGAVGYAMAHDALPPEFVEWEAQARRWGEFVRAQELIERDRLNAEGAMLSAWQQGDADAFMSAARDVASSRALAQVVNRFCAVETWTAGGFGAHGCDVPVEPRAVSEVEWAVIVRACWLASRDDEQPPIVVDIARRWETFSDDVKTLAKQVLPR
jgi:hypothetical protein